MINPTNYFANFTYSCSRFAKAGKSIPDDFVDEPSKVNRIIELDRTVDSICRERKDPKTESKPNRKKKLRFSDQNEVRVIEANDRDETSGDQTAEAKASKEDESDDGSDVVTSFVDNDYDDSESINQESEVEEVQTDGISYAESEPSEMELFKKDIDSNDSESISGEADGQELDKDGGVKNVHVKANEGSNEQPDTNDGNKKYDVDSNDEITDSVNEPNAVAEGDKAKDADDNSNENSADAEDSPGTESVVVENQEIGGEQEADEPIQKKSDEVICSTNENAEETVEKEAVDGSTYETPKDSETEIVSDSPEPKHELKNDGSGDDVVKNNEIRIEVKYDGSGDQAAEESIQDENDDAFEADGKCAIDEETPRRTGFSKFTKDVSSDESI